MLLSLLLFVTTVVVWNIADLGYNLSRWSAWRRFSASHLYGWGFHGAGVYVDAFSPSVPKIQGPHDEVTKWQNQWKSSDREFFGFAFHRGAYFDVKGNDVWYLGSGWSFYVPYWAILLVTVPLPMSYVWTMRRRAKRRKKGECAGCGYDLRASTDRCPECGAPIESREPDPSLRSG
jgi:hypothetical protein